MSRKSQFVREKIVTAGNLIVRHRLAFKMRERKAIRNPFSKNHSDKVFYIIRRGDFDIGLFSFINTFLAYIAVCIKNNKVPVIDMETYENMYLSKEKQGRENAWEYYFEQPMGYGLQDISKARYVIWGRGSAPFPSIDVENIIFGRDNAVYWKKIYKDYIRLNSRMLSMIDKEYNKFFDEDDIVLGIICRGSDYTALQPRDHAIQATPEMVIDYAEKMIGRGNYNKVYLASEDAMIIDKFASWAKDTNQRLSYSDVPRFADTGKKYLYQISSCDAEYSRRKRGEDYLMTTGVIAKCQGLLASGVSGCVYGAVLMADHFDEKFVFELGLYK